VLKDSQAFYIINRTEQLNIMFCSVFKVENPVDDAVEMIILNNMKAIVRGCGGCDGGGDSIEDVDDYDGVRLRSQNRGHHWPSSPG
jgi:hypothetical protein